MRCLAILFVFLFFFSCALVPDPRPSDRLVIVSWNVENLFDEVDDGNEYAEFDPEKGWTRAQFWGRCERLAKVIRRLNPDILALEEVEGSHALDVLRTRFLADMGYRAWFLAPDEVPGVKTAVLSRYPFQHTGLHFPDSSEGRDPLRPLVEVEIDLGGRSLVLLANHWKSRIPTPAATEGLRRESARVLSTRFTALEQRDDRPFLVAVGDFNTSIELSQSRADRALIPGGSYEGLERGLVVFTGKTAALKTRWPAAVWDPWETVDLPGTYLYQGDWDKLDHAFVAASSMRQTGWNFESFAVDAYAPEPLAFGPRAPDGVSDHFPVVLTLVRSSASP